MDVIQGTLDLLILRTLAGGPAHGWGLAQNIELQSRDVLRLNQGSLYPALHRLEDAGLITGEWTVTEQTRRRVKEYRLTRAGRSALEAETQQWRTYVQAIERVLGGA